MSFFKRLFSPSNDPPRSLAHPGSGCDSARDALALLIQRLHEHYDGGWIDLYVSIPDSTSKAKLALQITSDELNLLKDELAPPLATALGLKRKAPSLYQLPDFASPAQASTLVEQVLLRHFNLPRFDTFDAGIDPG